MKKVDPNAPEWQSDRDEFMAAVRLTKLSWREADRVEPVIDAIIQWSLSRADKLRFSPKSDVLPGDDDVEGQNIIKFRLLTGKVFWHAFPRDRDGAKFSVAKSALSTAMRQKLFDEFRGFSDKGKNDSPSIPTISFGDLYGEKDRAKLFELLNAALDEVKE